MVDAAAKTGRETILPRYLFQGKQKKLLTTALIICGPDACGSDFLWCIFCSLSGVSEANNHLIIRIYKINICSLSLSHVVVDVVVVDVVVV